MKYPYEFVDQMLQGSDDTQVATQLYCYSGKIGKENLMEFCTSKNGEFPDTPLYKLMIFDQRHNAIFTSALADMGVDQGQTNHLRAIYTYNHSEQTGNLDILDDKHTVITKRMAI
ncbi:hypothetical protein [Dyadobacter arcticus]|uniref:Uncharacterized protein n=1 Tax=Dyadobacter arcticus TaxID=1078754 RepID=A0ABX0UHV7_9BACT|nr:hypothetical protein [Dyadobacter arcticus]NIJ52609.1 hypothetical protein [Dyadobacter arcticus]